MSEFIVYRGLPGSGKSTAALQWVNEDPENRVRVNRDALRLNHYGKKVGLSQKQETQVSRAEKALVREYLGRGLSVVLDAMNLYERNLKDWYRIHPFTLVEFSVPEDVLRHRNLTRPEGDRLPADVLDRLIRKWYRNGHLKTLNWLRPDFEFEPYERPEHPIGGRPPQYVIVDLDGTLAQHTSGRSPYDYSRVSEDSVDGAVHAVISAVIPQGVRPVFVSGREDSCREHTLAWIENVAGFAAPELYMRRTGDKRDDTLVKYEIFNEHLRDRDILFALDDRDRVVQMWRRIGLKCLQVQEGQF